MSAIIPQPQWPRRRPDDRPFRIERDGRVIRIAIIAHGRRIGSTCELPDREPACLVPHADRQRSQFARVMRWVRTELRRLQPKRHHVVHLHCYPTDRVAKIMAARMVVERDLVTSGSYPFWGAHGVKDCVRSMSDDAVLAWRPGVSDPWRVFHCRTSTQAARDT